MKKAILMVLTILLPLIFSFSTKGNISVSPPEISISMNEDFINGNTSKKITVSNPDDYTINATWYLEHPNPPSYLRPNRTYIPDLSWIDVNPKWKLISPNDTGEFYIYLDIPENIENLNKHWETWITFKARDPESGGGFINFEFAIRTYIDTPEESYIINNSNDNSSVDFTYLFIAVFIIVVVIIIGILVYNKRKKRI